MAPRSSVCADNSSRIALGGCRLPQDGFNEFLRTGRADHSNNYGPLIRRSSQFECQERAALALCHNQLRYKHDPLAVTRKTKTVAFLKFLRFNHCRPELRKKLGFAVAEFCCCHGADDLLVIETFHGRLAGGTTPFILRYSTICP